MSRRHTHDVLLDIDRERAYRVLADIRRWPEWDDGIAAIAYDGEVTQADARFTLTPKGGPAVAMLVEAAEAPALFVDLAKLPLARMRSRHELRPAPDGRTLLRHVIETTGPLGWLWDRLVARKIAADLPQQAERMAAYAKRL